jgi:hypothetical protein
MRTLSPPKTGVGNEPTFARTPAHSPSSLGVAALQAVAHRLGTLPKTQLVPSAVSVNRTQYAAPIGSTASLKS